MVKIFRTDAVKRCTIAVHYFSHDGDAVNSYLFKSVADYFLSFLSAENRQRLDDKGHIVTHREQFRWLPEENLPWGADGLPEHERQNLDKFISQQQAST